MFKACLAQVSRAGGSTSSSSSSFIHSSSVLFARQKLTKKARNVKKVERREREIANRPSPILGYRPGQEEKWINCALAKVLIDEDELTSPPVYDKTALPVGTVEMPQKLAYGVTDKEARLLFDELPSKSSERNAMGITHAPGILLSLNVGVEKELRKANMFAKVVDLHNANAAGIAYENKRRIIIEFSTPENPWDPGRTEVQAAILTYRIRNMWKHLASPRHKKDVAGKRALKMLVYQRARTLKYLKRTDRVRYDIVLERLGLEPESVEGELMV
ncbi:hypothetical protein DFS33DRAFT_1306951 [Desarmillaria ectypa]|nr:hypothetical protein DFS33DRAFT_1306951 [Desarmillaria ectypa]